MRRWLCGSGAHSPPPPSLRLRAVAAPAADSKDAPAEPVKTEQSAESTPAETTQTTDSADQGQSSVFYTNTCSILICADSYTDFINRWWCLVHQVSFLN